NVIGRVIVYADSITESMQRAIDETNRRRAIQMEHNRKHGIRPETVRKAVRDIVQQERGAEERARYETARSALEEARAMTPDELARRIKEREREAVAAPDEPLLARAAAPGEPIQDMPEQLVTLH